MTTIRRLELRDAPLMLEWLTDPEVTGKMVLGRATPTLSSAERFIEASRDDEQNRHFAMVDDDDTYLGTVSLKNINLTDSNAEYAIALRRAAWGRDVAKVGTELVLRHAFEDLGLHKVYLCVAAANVRANRFYEKMGFLQEARFQDHIRIGDELDDLIWYCVFNPKEAR